MDIEHLPVPTWQSATQPQPDGNPEIGSVHLWRIALARSATEIDDLAQILSPDEHQRANQLKFDRHRCRFIAARASLRQILGQYLGQHPNLIQFDYGSSGKPRLMNCASALEIDASERSLAIELQFNLSHSEDLALLGVTWGNPIGVDLEQIRAVAVQELAQRYFSPGEGIALRNIAPDRQTSAFFQLWTAKEAYLKAIGVGISGLQQIELCSHWPTSGSTAMDRTNTAPLRQLVSTGLGTWQSVGPKDDQTSAPNPENWVIQTLIPSPGYLAAIATHPPLKLSRYWNWPGSCPHPGKICEIGFERPA